ncbi:MAG TPA: hypothetical protein VGH20_07055 [Myxococcales bacterium]|jgi:hypothetical protein
MRASLILVLAAACATSGSSASSVTLASNLNYGQAPMTFAVAPGHVRSNNSGALDAYFDKDCLKGEMAGQPLDLCQTATGADGTQHWEGTTGVVDITPVDGGAAFKVSGFLTPSVVNQIDVSQTLRPNRGGAWETLRQEPVLLLVATTANDLTALSHRHRRGL